MVGELDGDERRGPNGSGLFVFFNFFEKSDRFWTVEILGTKGKLFEEARIDRRVGSSAQQKKKIKKKNTGFVSLDLPVHLFGCLFFFRICCRDALSGNLSVYVWDDGQKK